ARATGRVGVGPVRPGTLPPSPSRERWGGTGWGPVRPDGRRGGLFPPLHRESDGEGRGGVRSGPRSPPCHLSYAAAMPTSPAGVSLKLIPADEARRLMLETPVLGVETVPLREAGGRVLAVPLAAPEDLPTGARSVMD